MASVNRVIIVGNLGADPTVRQTQNGGVITTISVATSEKWTDKNTGEPKEQTEWHNITFFNRLAEVARDYLRKGALVYIEGSLHTEKYTDQQGIERYATKIKAQSMQMLPSGQGQPQQQSQQHAPQAPQGYPQGGQWGNPPQNPAFSPQGQPQQYQQVNGHPTTMPVSQSWGQGGKMVTPPPPNDDMPF